MLTHNLLFCGLRSCCLYQMGTQQEEILKDAFFDSFEIPPSLKTKVVAFCKNITTMKE